MILGSISRKGFTEKVAWRKGLMEVKCPAQWMFGGKRGRPRARPRLRLQGRRVPGFDAQGGQGREQGKD